MARRSTVDTETQGALPYSPHIWSSPFKDGADFGVAAPQFTTFTVLGPQVGQRLLVYNPVTNNSGWIEALGVGPVGSPPLP